jgi:hypothetical protein
MFYAITEYKPFLDQRKAPTVPESRSYCDECMLPIHVSDDDLDRLLAKSGFCQCDVGW